MKLLVQGAFPLSHSIPRRLTIAIRSCSSLLAAATVLIPLVLLAVALSAWVARQQSPSLSRPLEDTPAASNPSHSGNFNNTNREISFALADDLRDDEFLLHGSNDDPLGLSGVNDKLIVSDNSPNDSNSILSIYRRSDVSLSRSLTLSSSISNIEGIHFEGSKMWASSGNNAKLSRYNGDSLILAPIADASKDIDLHTDNGKPKGVTGVGNTIWVYDEDDDKIYAYSTASGTYGNRLTNKEVNLNNVNNNGWGIWTDGDTMWVTDSFDDVIYAYDLTAAGKPLVKALDLDEDNGDPKGIWSDGTTMWVVDRDDDKIYTYKLADAREPDEFVLSSNNSDSRGLAGLDYRLLVTDNSDTTVYLYRRSSLDELGSRNFSSTNIGNMNGIHADGTDIWVSDWDDTYLYAYTLTDSGYQAVPSADINLHSSNAGPRGVTGHDTFIWVYDKDDTYIYAYNRNTKQRVNSKEVDLKGGNDDGWGVWTDGETMWVVDPADESGLRLQPHRQHRASYLVLRPARRQPRTQGDLVGWRDHVGRRQ